MCSVEAYTKGNVHVKAFQSQGHAVGKRGPEVSQVELRRKNCFIMEVAEKRKENKTAPEWKFGWGKSFVVVLVAGRTWARYEISHCLENGDCP